MVTEEDSQTHLVFIAFFALITTVVAFISWHEALDFDPCETFLIKPGACVEPGFAGIIIGGLAIAFGLTVLSGAIRNGGKVYERMIEPALLGWFGLMAAVSGGALAYAQWSIGI